MESGKSILLVAQKFAAKDEPAPEDLYGVCSVANLLQMLKLPDGTVKVLVEGSRRARIMKVTDDGTVFFWPGCITSPDVVDNHEVEAMARDACAIRPICEAQQENSTRDTDFA